MPISKEQRDSLATVAGETNTRGPRIDTLAIKWDGVNGELRKVDADGTLIPLKLPLELTFLKKRNVLKAYINDVSHFTSEYEYTSTIINLFKYDNGKTTFVDAGTPPQLRAKYPELKGTIQAYVLHEGDLCKLEIKGASLKSYLTFTDELDRGLKSFQYVTIVSGIGAGKKGAVSYKFMEFSHRDLEEAEFEEVKTRLDGITKELYEVDKFYAEKNLARTDTPQPAVRHALEEEFDEVVEEINPEDIPF